MSGTAKMKKQKKNSESGFVLPMAMMLAVVLTISGMGFSQLNHVENTLVLQEVDNQSAFYLANAGIERARETFKIPDDLTWTTILDGTDARYPTDGSPSADLCPDLTRGCVIPSFQTSAENGAFITADGDSVDSPDFPFLANVFDQGSYTVRAYNNIDDAGVGIDTDQKLTLRAAGMVRNERKIIQVDVVATSGMKLINCEGNESDPCPDTVNDQADLDDHLPDREPASTPEIPQWNEDYYRDIDNMPCTNKVTITGNAELVSGSPHQNETQMESDTCYFATGDIRVSANGNFENVVIFSDRDLQVTSGAQFTNTVLIGVNQIQLQGSVTTHAPALMPALISKGDIIKGDNNVNIYGNIYALGSIGTSDQHPWNPNQVEGIIIGGDVFLKAASTYITDDGKVEYYQFMAGFEYPDDLKGTAVVSKSWKEIE
jgi:hypothetical protein